MEILRLDGALCADYDAFLEREPNALLYQSLAYQDLLCGMLASRRETVVARDVAGRIRGVLPMLALDGPWGRVYNSLPFFGSNGGILADDPEARRALVAWYNSIAQDPGVASCTLITNPLEDGRAGGIVHNCTDYRIGQLSPIAFRADHAANLMARFHYKTRNMVRKAQKGGIAVAVENGELEFLRITHGENLAALGGTAKPGAFFDLLPRYFAAERDFRIYTARLDGVLIAALLVFYFNAIAEYYMPVIRKERRETQAMSLLIHTAMTDASRAGCRWWNWGGTGQSQDGVYRFKQRWGTEDRKYLYYVQLNRRDILRHDRNTVANAYPYFYVLPFGMLQSREAG